MSETPDEWALVEIMGYHRTAGRISEVERFGAKMLRVDMPLPDGEWATKLYGGSSIYGITPCTEEVARATAERLGDPRPISPLGYRLPAPTIEDAPDDDEQDSVFADEDERPF